MSTTERIGGAAAIAVAAALLLSISVRTGAFHSDFQAFLANRVVPAANAISSSIAEHSEEMAPP
jgi:hypothetical protein